MIKLQEIAEDIRKVIDQKREEFGIVFYEEAHKYEMKDLNGNLRNDFPSVSKVLKNFYEEFPTEEAALKKAGGNYLEAEKLMEEWKQMGEESANMGSRTHFFLETETISRSGGYKEVRQPIFDCDIEQITKGDSMISAGKRYLNLCEKRNLVLLDTEAVLGHPELGYTGQPDKVWLSVNAAGTEIGLLITDWKTNKEKNFKTNQWTKKMYPPFHARVLH